MKKDKKTTEKNQGITERKWKEEEASRMVTVVRDSNDAITIQDFEGKVLAWNRGAELMYGYSEEEALQKNIWLLTPSNRAEEQKDFTRRLIAGEKITSLETQRVTKDGRILDVWMTVTKLVDDAGKPIGIASTERDITERRRAEEALHDNEERFRIAAESVSDCIWEWDIEKDSLDWFGDIDSLLEYRRNEFPRTIDAWGNIIHPDDRDNVMSLRDRHIAERTPYDTKYRVVKKDGSIAFWVDRGTALRDENGKTYKMIGAVKDITKSERAKEALHDSEERFRALIESSLDVTIILDVQGNVIYLSPNFESMWGWKATDILGQDMLKNVHPDDIHLVNDAFVRLLQKSDDPVQLEVRALNTDSTWRTLEVMGRNCLENPAVRGIVVNFQDITERKRAVNALHDSEERFRSLVEKSLDVIIVVDKDFRISYVSPSYRTVLNRDPSEVIGKSALDFVTEFVHQDDVKAIMQTFEGGLVMPGVERKVEFRFRSPDGGWLNFEAIGKNYLDNPSIQGVVATIRDITERKQAEEALRKYKDHLEELVKERTEELDKAKIIAEDANKAKSDFLANMSHEIRTPLSSIIGFSELLYDELKGPLNDSQKKYLGYVTSSGQHLLSLINDILDLSKVEAGKMELHPISFSISDLLKNSTSFIVEKALKHNIRLISDISAKVDLIEADERKVKQIVYNLLSNAVKFTPDGGSITISADVVFPNAVALPVKIRKELPDTEYVLVSVKDTGIGIAKKDQSKLFTEFQQIEDPYTKKYEGTGLGLALSKRLVTLHGGKIWVESRGKGKGCTFSFILPLMTFPKD